MRIVVLEDFNEKVGELQVGGILDLYKVSRVNETREWLVELCVERN